MKYTIHLKPVNGGPFNCLPAREVEVHAEDIACNDIQLPWEPHAGNMKLWIIGNEFGVCGAVWAEYEQDAFDELCDQGLSDGLRTDDEPPRAGEGKDEYAYLGNCGEIHDLTNAWIQQVSWKPERDYELIAALAEARGAQWRRIGGP